MRQSTDGMMSVSEAARVLEVSRRFVYVLIDRGLLTIERNPLYIYGPTKIPRAQVESLRERRTARVVVPA